MSLGNAEQGTKITDYIFEFLHAYVPTLHLIYIPFILTIIYFIFERYITRDGFEKKVDFKSTIKDFAFCVYLALLCFTYYVTLEVDFMQNVFQTVTNKELFAYPSSPSTAIKNFGTTVYFILDVKGTLVGAVDAAYNIANGSSQNSEVTDYSRYIDDTAWESLISIEEDVSYSTLNDYFINREIVDANEYTGLFEGKNMIMIMMESISQAVFSEEYKDYFPTLYKLYTEGITGVNNYSPRNNCATGESEMTSEISLYSIETTCTVNTYRKNEYKEALMYMMNSNGYYTSSYHNYTEQYYYRKTFEYNFGSMKYYGVTDLGISYEYAYKEWPSDLELMEKAVPKFIDEDKFATYIVTVSAHTPYIFSSKMGNKHIDLFKDTSFSTSVKRYLSKVKELDLALEYLLNALEEKGKLEDTVLVLFGDHYPYGLSDKDYATLANYDIESNQEIDRTPFIIYNSATPSETIEKYTSPLDYAPTILNLFDIDYDPRYYLGHDVFSDYTDYVVFPDNSWQAEKGFYSASKGAFVPKDEADTLSNEEIIAINKEINDMRNMSALAIKKNYFSYLYKYFEEYEELYSKVDEPAVEESSDNEGSEESE